MPVFTIETTYRLPVYRHQTYEAATMEEACRLAVDDDDWSDEKRDYESAGETYVTGIWSRRECRLQRCRTADSPSLCRDAAAHRLAL